METLENYVLETLENFIENAYDYDYGSYYRFARKANFPPDLYDDTYAMLVALQGFVLSPKDDPRIDFDSVLEFILSVQNTIATNNAYDYSVDEDNDDICRLGKYCNEMYSLLLQATRGACYKEDC